MGGFKFFNQRKTVPGANLVGMTTVLNHSGVNAVLVRFTVCFGVCTYMDVL